MCPIHGVGTLARPFARKGRASLGGGGASVAIGSGASISVGGVIIEDLGDQWLVRLNMSIGGKNQIAVPK